MSEHILAIDQGTTGSRAFLFDRQGKVVAQAYQEFRQIFPKPGWVEHDPDEIWQSVVSVVKHAVAKARVKPDHIAAIGITNQRETTIVWDRKTGRPVHHAIVWQCRRTAELCAKLKAMKLEDWFRQKTGLVLDAYFSGPKITWLLDHVKGIKTRAKQGRLCFGTVDTWLVWKLTGGRVHATDGTNASRTLLLNLKTRQWDPGLLKVLRVPASMLPEAHPSAHRYGTTAKVAGLPSGIPIAGIAGDQQAALFGQGCVRPGQVKNTYGTGCFLLMNTGEQLVRSKRGLLTTLACDERGQPAYALEGSVFIAGAAIQWLRDQLKVITTAAETEAVARSVQDTNGIYFVPAFVGLGAPYWEPNARGLITGLTRGANRAHLIRAALEAIAYQTRDVVEVMRMDGGQAIQSLRVDGGACRNNFLMQFQADLLGVPVVRPKIIETTAQGAAQLAGLAVGLWTPRDLAKMSHVDRVFKPRMDRATRVALYCGWHRAIAQSLTKTCS